MDIKKIVGGITRAGSVIVTTLLSMVALPPLLYTSEAVKWKPVFIFISGVISLFLFDKTKNKKVGISGLAALLIVLVVLLSSYEIIYNTYSRKCFDHYTVVISHAAAKPKLPIDVPTFENTPDSATALLKVASCEPTQIWALPDLLAPYLIMHLIYFSMAIILILILVSASDITVKKITSKP